MIYFQDKFVLENSRNDFYDKCTRIQGKSDSGDIIILDVINELFKKIDKNFEIILSSEFIDGHCIMNGITYNENLKNGTNISFHGLLMSLSKDLQMPLDQEVYCIINYI